MRPMAAAVVGALIGSVATYAVSARAAQDPFAQTPAYVQTLDGQYMPVSYASSLRPVAAPIATRTVVSRPVSRTVYRTAAPARQRVVYEDARPRRSVAKTALIIGGSAASGAGVGGMVGGKKGALIGAALGGGAASIYEATRR